MPFFSIVIPAYNRAGLLKPTLRTILEQGFTDYEVIVVDDGSTDNMKEVVEAFSADHKNFRYIYQKNSERGSARNTGIGHATGIYVVMFDSDDFMHADHLQVLHSHIQALNQPDFIATKFDFTSQGRQRSSDIMPLSEGYYDYRLFLGGNPFACNICFRKAMSSFHLFEADRRYSMLEDWMFFLQNLRHNKVYLVDKVTISLNDHDMRSMKSNHTAIVEKAQLAFEWVRKHVPLSEAEIKILKAQFEYFSAIHCYLGNHRIQTAQHLARAIAANGLKVRYALLFLKSLPGHRFLTQFKR